MLSENALDSLVYAICGTLPGLLLLSISSQTGRDAQVILACIGLSIIILSESVICLSLASAVGTIVIIRINSGLALQYMIGSSVFTAVGLMSGKIGIAVLTIIGTLVIVAPLAVASVASSSKGYNVVPYLALKYIVFSLALIGLSVLLAWIMYLCTCQLCMLVASRIMVAGIILLGSPPLLAALLDVSVLGLVALQAITILAIISTRLYTSSIGIVLIAGSILPASTVSCIKLMPVVIACQSTQLVTYILAVSTLLIGPKLFVLVLGSRSASECLSLPNCMA